MDSIISTFHIDWKIIVAQAINFIIVIGVLYFYALKPLNKLMAERKDKIAQGLDDAKSNAETLSRTKKEYENTLAQARVEAQSIFEKGKKEAEAKKAEMLEKAKVETNAIVESGKKALQNEKAKMVEEARAEIVNLAMQATEKLLSSKNASSNDKATAELKHL